MNDLEVRSAMTGQTLALSMALKVLIALHPQKEQVLAELLRAHEIGAAFLLSEPVPDVATESYSDALQFVSGLKIPKGSGPGG